MAATAFPEYHGFPKCQAHDPPFPYLSGGRGLASASSSLRRLGNVDSDTTVPAPEESELITGPGRGSKETLTLEPAREQKCSHFQAPYTKGKLDGKAGIWGLGPRIGGYRKWCRGPGPRLTI